MKVKNHPLMICERGAKTLPHYYMPTAFKLKWIDFYLIFFKFQIDYRYDNWFFKYMSSMSRYTQTLNNPNMSIATWHLHLWQLQVRRGLYNPRHPMNLVFYYLLNIPSQTVLLEFLMLPRQVSYHWSIADILMEYVCKPYLGLFSNPAYLSQAMVHMSTISFF